METTAEKEKWRLLRRSRSNLTVAGKAVLAFGIWSILKLILEWVLGNGISQFIDESLEAPKELQSAVIITTLIIISLLVFLFHYSVFRGARKEASGKKTSYFYLFTALLLALSSAYSIYDTVVHPSTIDQGVLSIWSSILLDATVIGSCIDVMYNGIMCKRMTKELTNRGGE